VVVTGGKSIHQFLILKKIFPSPNRRLSFLQVEVVVEVEEVAAEEVVAEEVVVAEKREFISKINSLSHFSCPVHAFMTSIVGDRKSVLFPSK
jgi:hypothetical protein